MVMKDVKQNSLYVLVGTLVARMARMATMPTVSEMDRTKLWHLMLGHVNIKGIQKFSKQGLLCEDKRCKSL